MNIECYSVCNIHVLLTRTPR